MKKKNVKLENKNIYSKGISHFIITLKKKTKCKITPNERNAKNK